jgi:hypothetical protein
MSETQGLGLGLALFGTLMAAEQVVCLDRALRSRGWSTASGRVLDEAIFSVRWQFGMAHSPAVLYEYQVDGETYRAHSVSYRGSIYRRGAQAALDRYRPGQRVTVYYDPARPELAVLEPGASFGGLLRVLVSFGFLALGLWLYYGAS